MQDVNDPDQAYGEGVRYQKKVGVINIQAKVLRYAEYTKGGIEERKKIMREILIRAFEWLQERRNLKGIAPLN